MGLANIGLSNKTLTSASIVTRATDQVSADLGDESVILAQESGVYFGLEGVGSRMWSLLQDPISVAELRDAILEDYDVEANRCERDLLSVLEELAANGLIETRDETNS